MDIVPLSCRPEGAYFHLVLSLVVACRLQEPPCTPLDRTLKMLSVIRIQQGLPRGCGASMLRHPVQCRNRAGLNLLNYLHSAPVAKSAAVDKVESGPDWSLNTRSVVALESQYALAQRPPLRSVVALDRVPLANLSTRLRRALPRVTTSRRLSIMPPSRAVGPTVTFNLNPCANLYFIEPHSYSG